MSVVLVRHAKASSRSRWEGDDVDRPLTSKGWDQANLITSGLRRWPITLVATSPYLRCQQTVSGLAVSVGLELVVDDRLAEGAATGPARRWVDSLLTAPGHAVLCSHGDLVPDLLHDLVRSGMRVPGGLECAKGSTWIVTLTTDGLTGRYVADPAQLPTPG